MDSKTLSALSRLIEVMAILRGPNGCPWDREQDFASIAPYTLEEAHEVADAIERGDMADLRDELGDLLLQVVFHSQMASEAGLFDIGDVADAIIAKMERRHPHVFGPDAGSTTTTEVRDNWETIKAAEKPRQSALDGIALSLPALTRANKLAARAARTGFDWPDADGPLQKIHEELDELANAADESERTEEAGDLLFATANYLRKLGVDPETALRKASYKFEKRFKIIEQHPEFEQLSLDQKEQLWQDAKRALKVT